MQLLGSTLRQSVVGRKAVRRFPQEGSLKIPQKGSLYVTPGGDQYASQGGSRLVS